MKKLLLLSAALIGFSVPAYAGQDMIYTDGDTLMQGYFAPSTCENGKDAPVVYVIHQWKGLGAYEKDRSDMLAGKCYNVFAVDMYGKDVRPSDVEGAKTQSTIYKTDPTFSKQRINAARAFVQSEGYTNDKDAIIGYCFGGTMALDYARAGSDVDGVVSFHGGLSTKRTISEDSPLTASIQVHHGAADPHVPPEQVEAFTAEMDAANADWQLNIYADAVHAFTEKEAGNDPSTGVAYNEKADMRSWAGALAFLDEVLK